MLVQENVPVLDSADWTTQYFADTVTDLTRLSLTPPKQSQHPDLIVWPESPAPFYSGDPSVPQRGQSDRAELRNPGWWWETSASKTP